MIRRTIAAVLFACAVTACADSPVAPSRGPLTPNAPSLAVIANNHETVGPLVATNPCGPTPEGVSWTGKRQTVIKETGPFTIEVTQNWSDVKGVGLVTGNEYVLKSNTQSEMFNPPGPAFSNTTERHLHFIALGSADNFDLVVEETTSFPPLVNTINVIRSECRG
jgi:hypothetical protein